MDAKKTLTVMLVAMLATLLLAGPVAADVEEPPADAAVTAQAETQEEGRKPAIAETPRDRVGLILLGALAIWGILGFVNARRQLKGERPQASGEFRWR